MIKLIAGQTCALLLLSGLFSPAIAGSSPDFSGYTAVSLSRGRENHLMARGKIASRTVILLLDTGAPVTCIDETKQRFFGLEAVTDRADRPMKVVANGQSHAVTIIPELTFGKNTLSQTPAVFIDFSEQNRLSRAVREPAIDGILGVSELFTEKALLDCKRQQLFIKNDLSSSANFADALRRGGWAELDLSLNHGHLLVNGNVNGLPVRFIVDTGASMTNLDRAFCIARRIPLSRHRFLSAGINMRDTASRLAGVRLSYGPCDIGPVVLGVSDISMLLNDSKREHAAPLIGLLGCDLLEANGAIIDFDRMKLYLKRNAGS